MANKFIKVDYDKFENKRNTTMNYPYVLWSQFKGPREDGGDGDLTLRRLIMERGIENIHAYLRHISLPDTDTLLIDIYSFLDNWFFLRDGHFVININDVENVTLEPHESYSKVSDDYLGHSKCSESCFYVINQELLKKICEAKSVDFKISGKTHSFVVKANKFISYARRFYNGLYDENEYLDAINDSEEEIKGSKSKSSCLVTLLMAITTISSFAACLSFLIGLFFN